VIAVDEPGHAFLDGLEERVESVEILEVFDRAQCETSVARAAADERSRELLLMKLGQ
jgi:hypothetical protein